MTLKRRTVMAGLAALTTAAMPTGADAQQQTVFGETCWDRLPANLAETITGMMHKTIGRQCAEVTRGSRHPDPGSPAC